jgi:Fuc2NAc and GlcNAc transferase
LPVATFGLIDDVVSLSPKVRLFVQVVSASGALFFLGGLQRIDLGVYTIEWSAILSIIAVIAVVWFINLFNFLDGIDGYISTEVVFICVALFILTNNWLLLILVAAVAGFLVWNWPPAKIFMGDVGSTLLGFNVAIFSIYFQNTNQLSILNLLMLSSLFWFDATLTLLRRFLNKEDLSKAHRNHAYQRIVQYGFSHQKTVLFGLFVNVLFFGLALVGVYYKALVPLCFLLCLVVLFALTKLVDKRKPFPSSNSK